MNLTDKARDVVAIREAILAALKEHDSGRWQWERIHCCMTGKDADLTAWGQQGIELVSVTDTNVHFNVHCGVTYAGTDVSLNLPRTASEIEHEKALDAYLKQAQGVVCNGPGNGTWDGESWYFADKMRCGASLVFIDGVFNLDATVQSIFECYEEAVKSWDREAYGVSVVLDQLAGWKNMDGTPCLPGKPTAAAWMPDPEESDDEQA